MFFLRDPNGGVHVDGGEGLFFMNPGDAQAKLAGMGGVDGMKVMPETYACSQTHPRRRPAFCPW